MAKVKPVSSSPFPLVDSVHKVMAVFWSDISPLCVGLIIHCYVCELIGMVPRSLFYSLTYIHVLKRTRVVTTDNIYATHIYYHMYATYDNIYDNIIYIYIIMIIYMLHNIYATYIYICYI